MNYVHALVLTVLFLATGCGSAGGPVREYSTAKPAGAPGNEAPDAAAQAKAIRASADDPAAKAPESIPRKIIYTAEARLVVQEFEKAEQELLQLIKAHQGYVAQAETGGKSGSPRSGHWKVRIPVERFDGFLEAVATLGVPQKISRDSRDVTEEFYDLEARLKAKKVQETRLLQHLEKSTGKLEDILAVERELNRVRGEIEQHEGRLRLLANLSTLTTVTVYLEEIKGYVPPQTPTFGASVSRTFSDSLDALGNFGKVLVLILVAIAPWLPVVAVVGVPVWLVLRSRRQRTGTPKPPPGSVADVLPATE